MPPGSNDSEVPGLRTSKAPRFEVSVHHMNALQISSADGSRCEVQAMQTLLREVVDE